VLVLLLVWRDDVQPAGRQLSAAISGFIEGMGLYFEDFGVPRIAGRLLGLLLVTDRPLSLEEIATALGVSRASVSTNARMILATGLGERVSLPGDRRDYYAFTDRAWETVIRLEIRSAARLRELASDALAALAPVETPEQARLQATVAFGEFYAAELTASLERWRSRTPRHSAAHRSADD